MRALERVHPRRAGSAWPIDVAEGADGEPVAVYTSLAAGRDTFRYARFDAGRWETHPIAAAGERVFHYSNQGATLDHADPRRVVLSRTLGEQNEIELRSTADRGRTWAGRALTRDYDTRVVLLRGVRAG